MLPLNRTKQIFSVTIMICVALLGGFIYVYTMVQERVNTVSQLESKLALEKEKQERIQSIKHVVEDTQGKRADLNNYFIEEESVAAFITDIESIADTAGVVEEITAVGIQSEKEDKSSADHLENVSLKVNAEGGWNEVFHFLQLIENMPTVSSVNQVSFEHNVGEASSLWTVHISIQARKLKNNNG